MTKLKLDTGIRCGHFLSMQGGNAEPQKEIFIGIQEGIIREISPWSPELKNRCKDFIDGSAHIVMPGLINAHTHLAMTLFRGLEDDATFHHWLFERIIPLEMDLVNPEFIKVGTELAALECIRFGVTTVNEMYFFTQNVAQAWDQAGLRGLIGQGFNNHPMPEDKLLGTNKTVLFEKLYEQYNQHERIVPTLAPHSPYTCDDACLRTVAELSERYQAPIHIHLSETRRELEESLRLYKKTPPQRLQELGVLTPRTIAAHCVHLTDEDIELLRSTGTSIAHNPDSNLKLGCGIAPIAKYRRRGIPVGFGTDGAASNNDLNIFAAMDLGTKLQKMTQGDTLAMVASDALACATSEGARTLGLQNKVGSLEIGKEADIILIKTDSPNLQPIYDIRSLLVYSMSGQEVDTVLCRGKVLMRNRVFTTLDADQIYASVKKVSEQVQLDITQMDARKETSQ